MTTRFAITRRQFAATGFGALALGLDRPARAQLVNIRQGYQTNIWGMPTYYLLKSGALDRHGLTFQEFAVASGTRSAPRSATSSSTPLLPGPA
jgi:NitT/TauT family transport system substrate-binding protein